ncbi:MAG: hypothetical protein KDB61_09435 [Planctomycetes bacterium]|nr:hypothetical protein [Planctomycetota bacterium]
MLNPGRSLVVKFLDANGVASMPESVSLKNSFGELLPNKAHWNAASVEYSNVQREPLLLVAQIGTQTLQQDIGPDEKTVEVLLPAMGSLRTHFEEFPPLSGDEGTLIMRISGAEDGALGTLVRSDIFSNGATGPWDLVAKLHPGTYPVVVTYCSDNSAPENSATRTLFEGRVTIQAGEEAVIVVTGGVNPTASVKRPR